jgi:GT2 family glycosyltransferase
MHAIGVIVIGRNEGQRLRLCLASVAGAAARVVYVDSGSTDGSPAAAREMGVDVVQLDTSIPFTAARARNTGMQRLQAISDRSIELVQFVDGDCEVEPGWLATAAAALADRPDVALVCGRRRERFLDASVYNRLCDLEWDTPIGEATECGGDAMMRAGVFDEVGGYDESLIAGEEPELCVRLRSRGGKILRLDAPMTLHDAAMTRFGQWWKRNVRNGHAFAEGAAMHGRTPARHWVRQARGNWIWGMALPAIAIAAAWPTRGVSLLLLLAYPLQGFRIYLGARRRGRPSRDAALMGVFYTLCKFPQAQGQARYVLSRWSGRRPRLIEYKGLALGIDGADGR